MTNLYDMERQRLKLYGQMIKQDIVERQKYQRYEKELHKKKQTQELAQHIENTRKYEINRRKELKGLHSSLQQDNMMLSTFKNSLQIPHTYAEQGKSFLNQIQELDSKRLDRLKRQLYQQANENNNQTSYHRFIVEKIKQIEKIEDDRHNNRMKEMQANSIRNYQEIKRKHQQDMELYEKHKKLMEENQKYKDSVQSFTNVNHGLLDRYNRNQYMKKRANLIDNQQQIKKQIDEIQRRKSQQIIEYKKNIGDLEHSMLKSVFVKENKIQPRAYSLELKNQMVDNTLKKIEQNKEKKQKIQMNNIFGGVHGKERENMIKFIDKKLGIDTFSQKNPNNTTANSSFVQKQPINRNKNDDNPQKYYSARSPTPRSNKLHLNESRQTNQKVASPQQHQNTKQDYHYQPEQSNFNYSQTSSNNPRKYYKSFDVITGKQRFYAGQ